MYVCILKERKKNKTKYIYIYVNIKTTIRDKNKTNKINKQKSNKTLIFSPSMKMQ